MQNLVESRLFAGILNLETKERNGEHDDEQQDGDEQDGTQYYRSLAGASRARRHNLRDVDHFRPDRASQQCHSRKDLPPVCLELRTPISDDVRVTSVLFLKKGRCKLR
jgi:hypothetical protein